MEHYIEIAIRQGLSGAEALQFAEKQVDREERREERERERERQEKESEKRRQHELEMERMRIEADRESQHSRNTDVRLVAKRPRMPTFEDSKDDMDSYLSRFERIAEINQWPREDWAANLSALLTGQALDTYTHG